MLILKKISGKNCIKILCNKFNFFIVRQRGSHVILKKNCNHGSLVIVVPNHSEIKIKTLKSLLKQAKIIEKDFIKYQ